VSNRTPAVQYIVSVENVEKVM